MRHRSIPPQRGFFPQPTYLIGSFREDGEPNFTLITWITFCSANPPTLMFASSERKLTPQCVLRTGVFSANLVSADMLSVADYCGNTSGFSTSKCADTGVSWFRGGVLDVPVLSESPWVFECALVKTVRYVDNTVFFGEVKNILVDERIADPGYGRVNMEDLNPLVYAPVHYYSLGPRVGSVGDSKGVFPVGSTRRRPA